MGQFQYGKTQNQDCSLWTKEERHYCQSDTGSGGHVGHESQIFSNQPERGDRENGSESNNDHFSTQRLVGGILAHLVEDYLEQVGRKERDRQNLDSEIFHMKSRVQELQNLISELEKCNQ